MSLIDTTRCLVLLVCEEGQGCCMPMDSNGGIFQTANGSSSEDDDDEEDDEDDEDDDDDESDEEDLELISGHALDGEEEVDSDESSVEDEQEEKPALPNKGREQSIDFPNSHRTVLLGKKRSHPEANKQVSVRFTEFLAERTRMHWIDF